MFCFDVFSGYCTQKDLEIANLKIRASELVSLLGPQVAPGYSAMILPPNSPSQSPHLQYTASTSATGSPYAPSPSTTGFGGRGSNAGSPRLSQHVLAPSPTLGGVSPPQGASPQQGASPLSGSPSVEDDGQVVSSLNPMASDYTPATSQ